MHWNTEPYECEPYLVFVSKKICQNIIVGLLDTKTKFLKDVHFSGTVAVIQHINISKYAICTYYL